MCLEQFPVDTRVVVKSIDICLRTQAHQILVSNLIFGIEAEVEALTHRLVSKIGLIVDIGLHANDRLDSLCPHSIVEVYRAKHIAMIRHRHRIHPQCLDLLCQWLDLVGTVQ